jgi:formylglycine-generating enzyme required for sulfatase activity
VEFCRKLSDLPREKRARRVYRLPTEAEWEYSCRGGASSSRPFHFGNSLSSKQANFHDTALGRTCKVGQYAKNDYGLFDMHGNVWEWCSDWYGEDYYGKSPPRDPQGPSEGSLRVIRGGSWTSPCKACRSGNHDRSEPANRNLNLGFRVALVPSGR